ncbi:hypothetical protein BSKO_13869 [Bryopsis sp. KO-2023]|nr:hypothetical protein BSKO_13869 [Bryopsis sp. KO-2023]
MSAGEKDASGEATRSETLDAPLFERAHEDSSRDGGGVVATIIANPQETPPPAPEAHITMGVPVGAVVPGHIVAMPVSSADAIWLLQNQFMKSWLTVSILMVMVLFFTSFLSQCGPILAIIGASIYICPACRGHKRPTLSHVNTVKVLAIVAGCVDMVISAIAFMAVAFAISKGEAPGTIARAIITGVVLILHSCFSCVVVKRMIYVASHFNPVSSGVVSV